MIYSVTLCGTIVSYNVVESLNVTVCPKHTLMGRREVDDVFRDFSLTHQIGLKKSAPVEFGIRGGEKIPNLETFCPTGQPITMANGTMDCNVKLP
jgi:hypothetical protein